MRTDLTFTIVKPKAFRKNLAGPIIETITRNGFTICAMKIIRMSRELAEEFYTEHKEKSFFNSLIDSMTLGPVIVAVLQKENAIADFRELIGNTDPLAANYGTIRKMFAESKEANAIHGSDSPVSAAREILLFFNENELFFQ
jgi:nucleoside-diphosphate kinase